MAEKKAYLGSKKTKFKNFSIKSEVLSLLNDEGLQKPTLVQAESLPITLQDNLKDLCTIVYAYNGAGKTLTYLIPILNSLEMIPDTGMKLLHDKEHEVNRPQALIILPTQPLMSQVYDYLTAFAKYYEFTYKWPLKIGRIFSKTDEMGHIIVGLTKKMKEKLSNNSLFDFSELKWVVFDECDQIKDISTEDFKQILKLFSNKKVNNSSANFLITSATGQKASFREFIQEHLPYHNILELDSKEKNLGLEGITHYYCDSKHKDDTILKILQILSGLQAKPQVIIFFNQIKELWNFYTILKGQKQRFVINDPRADQKSKNNLKVNYVHGRVGVCLGQHQCPEDCSLTKSQRTSQLRNQSIQVLLGTQTIGRGIDIRTVSLVINYSEPKKNKQEYSSITYIHRVGRTGRYTDEGIALTFVSDKMFIKETEVQQKVSFKQMGSQKQIVEEMLICSKRNEASEKEGKMRWDNDN